MHTLSYLFCILYHFYGFMIMDLMAVVDLMAVERVPCLLTDLRSEFAIDLL